VTVTYRIDGIFRHQDSSGGGGLITDGDTQRMTAGAVVSTCSSLACTNGQVGRRAAGDCGLAEPLAVGV
jgi:Pirin